MQAYAGSAVHYGVEHWSDSINPALSSDAQEDPGVFITLVVRLESGVIGFFTVVKLIPLTLDRSLQSYASFL